MGYNDNLKHNDRAYNMSVSVESTPQILTVDDGCFSMMFTNIGDTAARINGMVIYPGTIGSILGDSRSISGHKNDIYLGILKLEFVAPIGASPLVEIVQLFYSEYQ